MLRLLDRQPRTTAAPHARLRRGKWLLRFAVFGLLAIALFLGVYGATGHYKSVYPLPLAAPEPNGLDDYLAASVLFQMKTGLSAMTVKMPKLLDESHMVQVNQPAIARLRVGLGKPCGIPFDPTGDTAYMNAQQCLYLAKLLRAESDFYSAGGNAGRAASSALDIIQIGEDIGRNGPLEYAFAGNTLQFFGQAALLKVVDILTPSENQSVVSRYVQLIQHGISPSIVIDNEGRWRIARLASEDDLGPFGIDVDSHSPLYVDRIRNVFQRLRWHMARDDAIRSMERYFETAAGEAGKVAPKRKLPPLPRGDAGKIAPVPGYFNHAINALNIVALRNRLLLIEIALHGYRARNGRLPDSLDALDLAPKLLADPSSGLPIVYKPSGDDYLLYGAGPDGVDDGGIPLDEPFQRTKGDIGIRAFMLPRGASVNPEFYRKVPHMKPPVLPSGSSALKP